MLTKLQGIDAVHLIRRQEDIATFSNQWDSSHHAPKHAIPMDVKRYRPQDRISTIPGKENNPD